MAWGSIACPKVDEWLRNDTLIDGKVRELGLSLADAFDWVDLKREQLEVWLFQIRGKRGAYVKSKRPLDGNPK